jgi:hypothetical protein
MKLTSSGVLNSSDTTLLDTNGNALTATSAGYAATALTATSAGYAATALTATSAAYVATALTATSAGYAATALTATSAGYAATALTATSAGYAATALTATSAGYAATANVATTSQKHFQTFTSPYVHGTNAGTWTGDVWECSLQFQFYNGYCWAQLGAFETTNTPNGSYAEFRYDRNATGFKQYLVTFTGSHLCLVKKKHFDEQMSGLIFSVASNDVLNITHSIKPTISETLPLLELCDKAKSKKVYGVFCSTDLYNNPCQGIASHSDAFFNEIRQIKTTRSVINALGEGGIWVCNKEGTFECGDFITSSSVPGYGVLQSDDLLHNYTVAKITSDCDFSLEKHIRRKVSYGFDISGNKMILQDEDSLLYEEDLDEHGNKVYEYIYETRFLLPDGTILENEDKYTIKKEKGEEVYIACFVGCIYHCG